MNIEKLIEKEVLKLDLPEDFQKLLNIKLSLRKRKWRNFQKKNLPLKIGA